jgi:hypothetical protein
MEKAINTSYFVSKESWNIQCVVFDLNTMNFNPRKLVKADVPVAKMKASKYIKLGDFPNKKRTPELTTTLRVKETIYRTAKGRIVDFLDF